MSKESQPASPIALTAADGYKLTAVHCASAGRARGRLIVAGATVAPQRFYSHFAQFAARQGIAVWTLDYRGVGLSRPVNLRDFRWTISIGHDSISGRVLTMSRRKVMGQSGWSDSPMGVMPLGYCLGTSA